MDDGERAVHHEHADRAWAAEELTWGLFGIPERDLGVLGAVAGIDAIELGCGTAYLSAQLARLGARPVGLDLTPAQLATAARCQERFGLVFPLVEATAEEAPFAAASFDLVVSEYGSSVWCDPERWVAEAARLLRPGGRLVFLTNSVLATLCVPEAGGFTKEQLLRPQRMLHRLEWPGGGIEFHPSHGDWIRMLSANGFVVEALHELYAPAGAPTHEYYDIATAQWASRWPVEDLWAARLRRAGHADGVSVFALEPVDPARERHVLVGPAVPTAGNRDPDRTRADVDVRMVAGHLGQALGRLANALHEQHR